MNATCNQVGWLIMEKQDKKKLDGPQINWLSKVNQS